MKDPNFILLYVSDPAASAAFYSGLLGRPVIESSPNFAMVELAGGVGLGLWASRDVDPKSSATGGGAEICFPADSSEDVDRRHERWSARGIRIAQKPTAKEFGYTFVGLDPDGHRLRVLHASAA